MAKESVFTKWNPAETDLIGYIIIHPIHGTGIITDHKSWVESKETGRSVYTVLWSINGSVEDVSGQVIRESRIIGGDETF